MQHISLANPLEKNKRGQYAGYALREVIRIACNLNVTFWKRPAAVHRDVVCHKLPRNSQSFHSQLEVLLVLGIAAELMLILEHCEYIGPLYDVELVVPVESHSSAARTAEPACSGE